MAACVPLQSHPKGAKTKARGPKSASSARLHAVRPPAHPPSVQSGEASFGPSSSQAWSCGKLPVRARPSALSGRRDAPTICDGPSW
eukprot:4397516-Amphidinium_carterae.1